MPSFSPPADLRPLAPPPEARSKCYSANAIRQLELMAGQRDPTGMRAQRDPTAYARQRLFSRFTARIAGRTVIIPHEGKPFLAETLYGVVIRPGSQWFDSNGDEHATALPAKEVKRVFLGGHGPYEITPAEAKALRDAGFADGIKDDQQTNASPPETVSKLKAAPGEQEQGAMPPPSTPVPARPPIDPPVSPAARKAIQLGAELTRTKVR